MKCIAHRGYSAPDRPENSLAAIQAALDLGADGIEIDLWFYQNRFWVYHDRRLPQSNNARIDTLTRAELNSVRLSNGEPLADLYDVLRLVKGRCLLNLEIKNAGGANALAKALDSACREHQLTREHLILSSFNHHELFACQQALPNIKIGVLMAGLSLDYSACASALQAYSFNSHIDLTTPALINDIHRRGMQSWVYTANYPEEWRELAQWRADAVFTDRTEQCLATKL
ncbi:glycerophosphodiester phosphodiesterase [Gilvimarinus sp. 1_MG-2023]|uniref:glycerophosphodiester phosphodiesterase n=1 Tax=Gilvimarinus sp. 1_MG-2023 TaxID=3062638 RepID=UPI0026E2B343|nr:glycerophosphodiester phosphodiesterase [Gilvimarinus sp. 1_MG-2023]MDO6746825.1 glycerophosphodiester phosphodiesterase [Gilvimarinus sp. 1_MG-2023]